MKFGLLGRYLSHSYSPEIHAQLGSYSYELIEREPEELEDFFQKCHLSGFNVTVPYKKAVIPYLEELSPIAQKLGAVNTIIKKEDGRWFGHNTDYYGFSYLLKKSGICVNGKKVLVLGNGGASATVQSVLRAQNADVIVISRSGKNNYNNLHLHADASVIVNATPVGMYPDTGVSPISLDMFCQLEGVLDLIYNPARTKLILDSEMLGIPCFNGLWMLIAQAKEASEYFTGQFISDDTLSEIYNRLCRKMYNIILIGMPGCGKSTVASLLSEKLSRQWFDSDAYIEEIAGMTIPDIFRTKGETYFRKLETDALSHLGKQSGIILATGGGCVTRAENLPLLCQNGKIIWLKRDLAHLSRAGRPLSQIHSPEELYAQREVLYNTFSDIVISNDSAIEETISAIVHYWRDSL